MNRSYIIILIVALILLSNSIIQEYQYPELAPPQSIKKYIGATILRYIHYVVFLFTSFYLLFFMGTGSERDKYLFLIIILGTVFGWFMCDCCWLTYTELLFYDRTLENIESTFHPTFKYIFCDYDRTILSISGILYPLNVFAILYTSNTLSIPFKTAYLFFFTGFFVYGALMPMYKTCYYSRKNAMLNWFYETYNKLIK